MGLLTDFYNTVAKFFRPQEFSEDEASKSVATNRLKLVLMQDRTNLTPKILEQMRGELVDLLSKYLEMDKELLELNFEQEGDQVALMLSIPVIRAKDEEEIEAILEKEKAEKEDLDDAEYDTDESDDEGDGNIVEDESNFVEEEYSNDDENEPENEIQSEEVSEVVAKTTEVIKKSDKSLNSEEADNEKLTK